jgi:single-strand DNA-binding protein
MSVNKVILIGNVGKDPEVRYFDNGAAVVNLTLATTERGYTATNGTQVPDRTEWHNVVLWRGLAKVAEQYVKKGTQLYIEGKIRTRTYDDQQGIKRYVYEIFADNMELLGRRSAEENANAPHTGQSRPASSPQPQASTPASPATDAQSDDDLPF